METSVQIWGEIKLLLILTIVIICCNWSEMQVISSGNAIDAELPRVKLRILVFTFFYQFQILFGRISQMDFVQGLPCTEWGVY